MELNHASWMPDTGKFELKAFNKSRTGPLNKIGLTYFSSGLYLKNDRNGKHAIRITGISENEGPYIKRPRAYINYAYELQLSKNLKISSGLAMGVLQNYLQNPNANTTEQRFLPDAQISLGVQYKMWNVYGSSLQLLNNKDGGKSTDQLKLRRFYSISLLRSWDLSPFITLNTNFLFRIKNQNSNDYLFDAGLTYMEKLGAGFIFSVRNGSSVYVKIKEPLEQFPLSLFFLYRSNLFSSLPKAFNHTEVGLRYRFY